MEYMAVQSAVNRDWITGKIKIEYLPESPVSPVDIQSMAEKKLRVKVTEWKEKRSLDANAYYWMLLTRLSGKLGISKPSAHNLMLQRYGQMETINGRLVYMVVPDSDGGARQASEAETYHIKPTSEVKYGKDGSAFRTYILLRGSSTYNTEEMSKLINGLVSECEDQGIETLTPDQMAEMMVLYERNYRRKHADNYTE